MFYIMSLFSVFFKVIVMKHRPVGQAVTRLSLERKVGGSNLEPVKSETVLPTARHCFEKSCVARRRNNAEMGPAHSLHVSA